MTANRIRIDGRRRSCQSDVSHQWSGGQFSGHIGVVWGYTASHDAQVFFQTEPRASHDEAQREIDNWIASHQ